MDYIEKCRVIAPLWVNEAIRNGDITPHDFEIERGKRYEKYYCIKPNSHAHELVRRVSKQILQTKFTLTSGSEITAKQRMFKEIGQLRHMLNQLPNSTIDLYVENSNKWKKKTIWKKLQETNDKNYLTEKEFQLLKKHVHKFFRNDFSFNPYIIAEII